MKFQGLPDSKVKFDRLPSVFFTDLLPKIDHLGELKVTIYFMWRLDRMEGDFRYLTDTDILEDITFISGLADSKETAKQIISESLQRCLDRGTLLEASVDLRGKTITLYFFNSPKGRATVKAIQNGNWRPTDEDNRVPIELIPERPNIFRLYEENIGPITPLLAETLADAEEDYPIRWIEKAFRIAVENNARNWRYVEAILRRWHERGYDVREHRRDSEKTRQQYTDWED
jgi:DnaD/phage-associated family protein